MKKIAVITTTRADYGILVPLIKLIDEDHDLALELIVSGGHLLSDQGNTINEIYNDGFEISHKINIFTTTSDTPYDISVSMANAIYKFAEVFRDDRPDMAIILGDRTEMLAIASAAMNERIPITHIGGGEITEGAVDDCVRHALTKMSYLHFTGTEQYRNRIIQLGESPDRVFNVGNLSTDNILKVPLMDEHSIRKWLMIPDHKEYVVATFHPVTLEEGTARKQVLELVAAMNETSKYFYVITKANTDTGGMAVNKILEEYASNHDNVCLHSSLGMIRYLSAIKYAKFVLGNSSSGISEAPVIGTPTVNIGDRQKGRIMADSVISCEADKNSILDAIRQAENMEHVPSKLFGNGDSAYKILRTIKHFLFNNKIELKKGFYIII